MNYIRYFNQISMNDVAKVGGKTASLGEMFNQLTNRGLRVPNGFAITSQAYWHFLDHNALKEKITAILKPITQQTSLDELKKRGAQIRQLILQGTLPEDLAKEIDDAYSWLSDYYKQQNCDVAVRSSATAEDLPGASFAGQQETFLNVKGNKALQEACIKCFASLFTDRAIMYRIEKKFDHMKIALSIGVQKMVRSDLGVSGVMFTLDTESGFKDVVIINGSWGLGEAIVLGKVSPDEFWIHKPTFKKGFQSIIKKELGTKEIKIVYGTSGKESIEQINCTPQEQKTFCLSESEIVELTQAGIIIEEHYSKLHDAWTPMDIEWAKDGNDGKIYIVQARPETVHAVEKNEHKVVRYHLETKGSALNDAVIATGQSIGQAIASGPARIIKSIKEVETFNEGDILITQMTDPDWVPLMKKAAALVTERGGRTSHAAIVSRELGIPAIVGVGTALSKIKAGQEITIDCSRGDTGYIYGKAVPFKKEEISLAKLPELPVDLYMNIAEPERAFSLSWMPIDGIGLARTEFIITNKIKMHPMAAVEPERITDAKIRADIASLSNGYSDTKSFFVDSLAQGVATIAAAFYPKPVIVRFSDFKSNEYRNLVGGSYFEPQEENPMLGLRGASRYYNPLYQKAFELECQAMKIAREKMGFTNIVLMIPFVRTVAEAQRVIEVLKAQGLERGKKGLQLFMMCEIPSNVILIKSFCEYFDGISIGSNDLTQTTLAVDRDSQLLTSLFDERDEAVMLMMKMAIEGARKSGKHTGICGQAPSDYPEVADFLIKQGIDSISLNPDSIIPFLMRHANKK
ncbi:phosphoenolpyruvate synthase [Candidatus Dependentiae bacterium]|nr:phosphoenolpyruvate synthase [Candidatus Dependentiae bacterium]